MTLLYKGKAKELHTVKDAGLLRMLFCDDTSAFDGKKTDQLAGKGRLNGLFNWHIMQLLRSNNVHTCMVDKLSDTEYLVAQLKMFKVEVIVRNDATGSFCRRYGSEFELTQFDPPLVEFCYKSDEHGDPLINMPAIVALGLATKEELLTMQDLALHINSVLRRFFGQRKLNLVDFKLEFGTTTHPYKVQGEDRAPAGFGWTEDVLMLGDEFSLDSCRLWTKEGRGERWWRWIRHDLGPVIEGYQEALDAVTGGL